MIYNILIVEDDLELSSIISKKLAQNESYQVQVSNSIKKAHILTRFFFFDLICLDIKLPDGNGLNFCSEIKKELPSTKIIIISKKTEVGFRVKSFDFGADDYLPKPFHPRELEARIKKQLGLIKKEQNEIKYKNLSLNTNNFTLIFDKYEMPLTKTEYLLLKYLFENQGFANLEILSQFLSSKKLRPVQTQSVIVSIKRLRTKLEKTTGNPFIKTKYGSGYYIP